jgi:carbon storage regulator
MLVLSRKRGELIQIGDNVFVEVVEVRGDKVRLGITAPPEVRVDRREVRARIDACEEIDVACK